MNPLSYQVELFALAVFLYLYDSTALLYANEAVLTCAGPNRWIASWGWSGFLIAGRTVCMLNPLAPHRPSFRLRWNPGHIETGSADVIWPDCTRTLQGIARPVVFAGIALFVLLPLGMFSALGVYVIVPAVILLYGSAVFALVRLFRVRSQLGMNRRRLWSLAFECLACPPFAVNLQRRISLSRVIAEPLPIAAARLLGPESWAQLRTDCLTQIDVAMQLSEGSSEEYRALAAHKNWLAAYDLRP